ncbi:hypothetical protein [Actinomadura violacea]|uniref:Uncharacterized protein n=1 Tax=Actinomadura violacea TaxID=2819934 RepID=A0ABS3S5E2_9ACTN|nr:hypothetical protein [Actinomadura violacea]MBO2464232.1 hypothetical protein [Actinomadura violacea]
MPSDPARSPLGDRHICSMPGCTRPSCFQVRLETAGAPPPGRGPRATAREPRSPSEPREPREARGAGARRDFRGPGCDAASRAGDSCGTHLADVVQALARRSRGGSGGTAQIVVYATPEGRHRADGEPPGPFDRFTLGVIPI